MENKQIRNSHSDVLALFLAIIALHVFFLAFVLHSGFLLFVVIIDSIIAIVLGSRTNSNYGHGAMIISLFTIIVSIIILVM